MSMLRTKRLLILFGMLFLFAIILGGCSAISNGIFHNSKAGNHGTDSRVELSDLEREIGSSMPVISIHTKKSSADSLKFIDEPIARHVAESIATWTPDYVIPPEPYYEDCLVSVLDGNGAVVIDNEEAQVKVRGNWTSSYPKKPLKIKFSNNQSMLGMNEGKPFRNWLLLAEYKDASMLRDKAALQIANAILKDNGFYASDTELVSVFVNGDYRGIYLLTEPQEIKGGRVDVTDAEKGYTGTDIGYLMEMDGYFYSEEPLNRFHISYNDNAALIPYDGVGGSGRSMKCLPLYEGGSKKDVGFSIKSDIYSEEQNTFIANFVENTYRIMYEAAYNDVSYVFDEKFDSIKVSDAISPREAIERVVDVKSLADMYLISELTCDADIYWSSFFMSADFGTNGNRKLTFQAPWDFDSGLGNKNRCEDGTGYYAANIVPDVDGGTDYGWQYDTINPWLAVLAYEDWFMDMVRDEWKKAMANHVFEDAIAMIENYTDRYADEFTRNYGKWNNIINNGEFVGELSARARQCQTQEQAAEYLSEWLQKRVDFLNGEFGE